MSEGIPVHFIGGTLGGKTLLVDSLRPRWRAAVPPPPMPIGPVNEASPFGGFIYYDDYELVWRHEGPNVRKPYYRLIDN